MGISKRLRYEILRRDSHTCRYCGAKAPDVEITVDHVIPKALGGTDDPSNLVAACRDCNSGKTSAHPDSPLVAGVADDALRWSAAVKLAAGRMLADHAGRQRAYDQFEGWWAGWNYGFKKLPLPKPDDWRNSIDSFLAAGLPLDVLKWCVDKAGASKAAPDQTWRYMCGIAWKKVTELQQAARSITDEPEVSEEDEGPQTPDQYAAHLLAGLSDIERAKAYRDEEAVRDDPDDPCESDEGRAAGALWFAIRDLQADKFCAAKFLEEFLRVWPGGLGRAALEKARQDLRDRFGDDFDEFDALVNAAWEPLQELQLREAEEYLATLPEGQREAWIERARIVWTSERDLGFDDWFYVTEAAELARKATVVAAG